MFQVLWFQACAILFRDKILIFISRILKFSVHHLHIKDSAWKETL